MSISLGIGPGIGLTPGPTQDIPDPPPGPGATGNFVAWSDGFMYDPAGNKFIVRGVDIFPNNTSSTHQNALSNCFGVNTIILNYRASYTQAQAINAINIYTGLGIVVVVEDDDSFGGDVDPAFTQAMIDRFRPIVQQFHANPYVWYQPFSEPQGRLKCMSYPGGVPTWVQSKMDELDVFHRALYDMIRNQEGSDAPFVFGSPMWGQDWKKNESNVPVHNEAVTELAASLKFNVQWRSGLDNVIFMPHLYGFRQNGDVNDLIAYFDAHKALGSVSIMNDISSHTEAGAGTPEFTPNQMRVARQMWEQNIGTGGTFWHWHVSNQGLPNGVNAISDPADGGHGININNCQNPTNLTEYGQLIWDLAHKVVLQV